MGDNGWLRPRPFDLREGGGRPRTAQPWAWWSFFREKRVRRARVFTFFDDTPSPVSSERF
jgi:hypothetical protein